MFYVRYTDTKISPIKMPCRLCSSETYMLAGRLYEILYVRTSTKPAHCAQHRIFGFCSISIVRDPTVPPWSSRPSCSITSLRAEDSFGEERRPPMFSSNCRTSRTRRDGSPTSSRARAITIIDRIYPMPILADRCATVACGMFLLDKAFRHRPNRLQLSKIKRSSMTTVGGPRTRITNRPRPILLLQRQRYRQRHWQQGKQQLGRMRSSTRSEKSSKPYPC